QAHRVFEELAAVGVDMGDVAAQLERCAPRASSYHLWVSAPGTGAAPGSIRVMSRAIGAVARARA
ncbi:hypothetical protein, partial [Actinotignum sp. GS-2025e]|uniref:hypothetical protein n=1 Tax=Actinotignum sp. GS-2025e TaxID=3427278 RepID=UPI003F48A78C